MCDLKAYVMRNATETLLLESVNLIYADQGEVRVRNLFGEEVTVHGEIREVSLVKNRVIIEQR